MSIEQETLKSLEDMHMKPRKLGCMGCEIPLNPHLYVHASCFLSSRCLNAISNKPFLEDYSDPCKRFLAFWSVFIDVFYAHCGGHKLGCNIHMSWEKSTRATQSNHMQRTTGCFHYWQPEAFNPSMSRNCISGCWFWSSESSCHGISDNFVPQEQHCKRM